MDCPGRSANPPPPKLSPGVTAGQMSFLHWLMIVNTRAESARLIAPAMSQQQR
jgi:hypothetical protein